MVNTIPPLRINRASRGTAPDQNMRIPSSRKILAAQAKLFLYSFRASIDCMLFRNVSLKAYTTVLLEAGLPCLNRIQRLRYVPTFSISLLHVYRPYRTIPLTQ